MASRERSTRSLRARAAFLCRSQGSDLRSCYELTRGTSSNIVLMDGQDLMLILEGHVSLDDGLDLKIRKAAQEGIIYFPLAQRFSE